VKRGYFRGNGSFADPRICTSAPKPRDTPMRSDCRLTGSCRETIPRLMSVWIDSRLRCAGATPALPIRRTAGRNQGSCGGQDGATLRSPTVGFIITAWRGWLSASRPCIAELWSNGSRSERARSNRRGCYAAGFRSRFSFMCSHYPRQLDAWPAQSFSAVYGGFDALERDLPFKSRPGTILALQAPGISGECRFTSADCHNGGGAGERGDQEP
jgi:hypothetical protein